MKCGQSIVFGSVCACLLGARAAAPLPSGSFLTPGDNWTLVGDSITSTDTYRQILQLALNHYHPDSKVTIANNGVWGQLLKEAKDLDTTPQVVSIMIAMNSVIHHEYGTKTDFSKIVNEHIEGLRQKIHDYQKKGAKVILMTPTLTDEREGGFFVTYNSRPGLLQVDAAVRQLAHETDCLLVPVAEELEDYLQTMGPYETFCPDGVHPYGHGQYVIANSFLKRMRFDAPLGGPRWLSAPKDVKKLDFKPLVRFLDGPDAKLTFATAGIRGRIRWSVWCDSPRVRQKGELVGHEMARGEAQLDGAEKWTLPADAEALRLLPGERSRVMIDIVPEDGVSRLFCVDLASAKVYHMTDGEVAGELTTTEPRSEGPKVCTWRMKEDGPDLWFTGHAFADSWQEKKHGTWDNLWCMNGLQLMWDFRPADRFATINPDRDTSMTLLSITAEPHFAALPFVWFSRRYQGAYFADAERTADGWNWTVGFRGNITDCEAFDIRKLDYFGFYLLVADDEKGKMKRYTPQPFIPADDYVRRMNQLMIFDRKNVFKGDAVTTVDNFAF